MRRCICHHIPPNSEGFEIGKEYNTEYIMDAVRVHNDKGYKDFYEIEFLWYFKRV